MPRRRTSGLSAGEAMLGLVIEQPDSASRLGQRLVARFRSAQFTRSTGHNALNRLVRQGLVRVVLDAAGGEERYEATPRGVERFRSWLRSCSPAAPALREELQAKVAFCAPADLPELIEAIGAEERACANMFAAVHGRLSAAALLAPQPAAAEAERWTELVQQAVLRDEAAMWGMRFKRLERLRARLEAMRAELPAPAETPAPSRSAPARAGRETGAARTRARGEGRTARA
jgi:DNA-binding PadR family transcriptional regulator